MSGVEALGIASSVIQVVDFGVKVLTRLNEYRNAAGGLPERFEKFRILLPGYITATEQMQNLLDQKEFPDKYRKTLQPIIDRNAEHIEKLDGLIAKVLPMPGTRRLRRVWNAGKSLTYDEKIDQMSADIMKSMEILSLSATIFNKCDIKVDPPIISHPRSNVPFRRDLNFIYRKLLETIAEKSQLPIIALFGLGGVGKSQLVVEHSYRIRDPPNVSPDTWIPDTWVFWVHAGSRAKLAEGYRNIAASMEIPDWYVPGKNIPELVHNWLSDEAHGRWLMIVDNADDLDVFCSSVDDSKSATVEKLKSFDFLDYLPKSQTGTILITSRSRDVAFRMTGDHKAIIQVDPMDEPEALALLDVRLLEHVKPERKDAISLIETLDFMPLAISQAAAFINHRSPRASVSTYVELVKKADIEKSSVLEKEHYDNRRDRDKSNSILLTWRISFEHIRREAPSAARLLSLMHLFDRQGIPESLLIGQYGDVRVPYTQTKVSANDCSFEDDWPVLSDYSLITPDVDGEHFAMHRLVQLATRKWLENAGELEGWMQRYVYLLNDKFPKSMTLENRPRCLELFPHAEKALLYRPADRDALIEWASLIYVTAESALGQMIKDKAAEPLHKASLEVWETIFGDEDPRTVKSLYCYAWTIQGPRQSFREAEPFFKRALKACRKMYGLEHWFTLMNGVDLGSNLREQGRFTESEQILEEMLDPVIKVFGPGHTPLEGEVLGRPLEQLCQTMARDCTVSLATTLRCQGKEQEAQMVERRQKELDEQEVLLMERRRKKLDEQEAQLVASWGRKICTMFQREGLRNSTRILVPGLIFLFLVVVFSYAPG
ncbi:P-loop containing nucleoside triphosphate hydrolase protein [Clohesyomyces aquaticus]|uniref:p-loop containing nucleoside triphosphate hydrolase protein n=1 Tax=Clohesyomyces aquaticus TaxID=1231657 RepID=A0A1Y1ZVI0_9PLEO|nr:P-loop containing nucleoside triphosphate hydrolase protein [Clohesyomyces aquaticus]